ncbi:hypothetical protein BH09BAC1_BH09BAC1_27920 [soil metagenome]
MISQKILLIDDDLDDQELFLDALATVDAKTECLVANDGLEALNLLQDLLPAMPDLIFLDLNMPRMDGIKFLQEVKAIEGIKDIPVLVYSTSNQAQKQVGALGTVDYLVKPDNFNSLCEIITAALSKDWRKV